MGRVYTDRLGEWYAHHFPASRSHVTSRRQNNIEYSPVYQQNCAQIKIKKACAYIIFKKVKVRQYILKNFNCLQIFSSQLAKILGDRSFCLHMNRLTFIHLIIDLRLKLWAVCVLFLCERGSFSNYFLFRKLVLKNFSTSYGLVLDT